ncbi:uncharacterized protein [Antedon mediterranea]|uniref:uncharacterized protein n=1 Tax=Antedon mediterranea TaxID=105859 RepID=UPI003AF7FADA
MFKDLYIVVALFAILPLIAIAESKSTCQQNCEAKFSCANVCSMYCACRSPRSVVAGRYGGKSLTLKNGRQIPCSDINGMVYRCKRVTKRIYTPDEDRNSFIMESDASWQDYDSTDNKLNEEMQSTRMSLKQIIRQILRQESYNFYDWNSEPNF